MTEELGLTRLGWSDDANLDTTARQTPIDAAEACDPSGMKTFLAVATHMRKGGTDAIPTSGKPNLSGDHLWDERFTAKAVGSFTLLA